jgi:Ca2+-binding RTX toxin-like protein
VLEICPPGSTLEVVQQECVIKIGGETIIVSRPFKGPSGGTVYALSVARAKFPHNPCLYGPGPQYALIAYKRGGRVEGTEFSDRILAIGSYERVAGLGGNDCLFGRGKSEKLFDGNGKERVYSNVGNNRIAVGNGNDKIVGGRGNDTISAGNGKDVVYGNGGRNTISVGIGSNRVYATKGVSNHVFSPGTKAHIFCGSIGGRDKVFLRLKALLYAEAHGCTRHVHLI